MLYRCSWGVSLGGHAELDLWQYRACPAPGTIRSRQCIPAKEIYFAVNNIALLSRPWRLAADVSRE
jgi:hypothetical protein